MKFIFNNIYFGENDNKNYLNKAVPQGLASSPRLFNIYLDDLNELFTSDKVKLYSYADDVVAVGTGDDNL